MSSPSGAPRVSPSPDSARSRVEFPLPLKGISVLIVDDEEDVRDLVHAILVGAGATVIVATSAAEALAVAKAAGLHLIVSDIGMPGKDGYQLIAEIRALAHHAATPAIAFTAFASAADRARVLKAGFQVHLTKPSSPAALVATVRKLAAAYGHTTE